MLGGVLEIIGGADAIKSEVWREWEARDTNVGLGDGFNLAVSLYFDAENLKSISALVGKAAGSEDDAAVSKWVCD